MWVFGRMGFNPLAKTGHTDVMKAAKLDKSMVVIFWPGALPVKQHPVVGISQRLPGWVCIHIYIYTYIYI